MITAIGVAAAAATFALFKKFDTKPVPYTHYTVEPIDLFN